MNRAQRRQLARSSRKPRKGGLSPPPPAMTPDVARDMETAVRCHQAGDRERAAALYRSVLARVPNQPDALNFLGLIAGDAGEPDRAIELIERSLRFAPQNAVYHNNLGNVLRQAGALEKAVYSYRRAVRYAPDYAVAHNNLGVALNGRGENDEAEKCFRRAIEIEPAYFDAYNNLGTCLYLQTRLDEAETAFRDAVRVAPTQLSARNNLANVIATSGHLDDAIAVCRAALEVDPRSSLILQNLARLLEAQCRFTEAEEAYRQALDVNPGAPDTWNNYGNLLRATLRVPEAVAAYRKSMEIAPATAVAHSNVLFSLGFDPDIAPADILAEARRWNELHAAPLSVRARSHANSRDADRRLRVGFVSRDFRDHAVGSFLSPLFETHDPTRIEIFAYADVVRPDARTDWFEVHADRWSNVFGMSDAQLAQRIRDDRVDVLIDLAGHTGGNRLLAFAERPAPVQATWLGYGGTTGMDAMDWLITDTRTSPPGTEAHYSERLIRLPQSLFCYRPETDAPPVGPLPARASGHSTFGSFNNLTKVNPRAVASWAEVLSRLPGSRMVIKGRGLDEDALRARFLDAFAGRGVAADRLDFIDYQTEKSAHLALFNRVDMVLDTFPYSGATTTCEALWMGVPVVTIAGDRYVSRMAAGILGCVGLDELVAADASDYVARAAGLAADLPRLEALRTGLRDRVAASPLCDGPAFAAAMEDAIRHMWSDWCRREKRNG